MAIEQAAHDQLAADCCELMDSLKSRTLTTVLSLPRTALKSDNVLQAQFEDITRELDVIEYLGYRDGPSVARKARTASLLATRANLLERLRITDARWRRLSVTPPLDLRAVSEGLSRELRRHLALTTTNPI